MQTTIPPTYLNNPDHLQARWIDLGQVSPIDLYSICQGVAEAQAPDALPVVLWGRCDRPHVCIGAGQSAEAEINEQACRALGIEVVRRPLGGGAVLVDPDQWCFFYIVPKDIAPRTRGLFLARCLDPVAATYRMFGLAAARVGEGDLWLNGRKILGSGAATIGSMQVLGASFMMRFDAGLFAQLIRCPSEGFRQWLVEELGAGMTDWSQHAPLPDAGELSETFKRYIAAHLGWQFQPDEMSAREYEMIVEARIDLLEPMIPTRRRIAGGLKIRHGRYLLEYLDSTGWVRLVVNNGVLERVLVSNENEQDAVNRCVGEPLDEVCLQRALAHAMHREVAAAWAARLMRAAADVKRVHDG